MYSSIIVGQNDLNSPKACRENTEVTGVTGVTGLAVWLPFLPPLPSDMWTGWTLLVSPRNSPTLFNSESLILHFLNTSTFYFSLLFVLCVCACAHVCLCASAGVHFNQQESVYDNTITLFLLLLLPLAPWLSVWHHTVFMFLKIPVSCCKLLFYLWGSLLT